MFKGKLVRLRAFAERDVLKAYSFMNDYEVVRNVNADAVFPTSLDEEEKFIFSEAEKYSLCYEFAIETLENMEFIGCCSVKDTNFKDRTCSIGIIIGNKDYWGKSYGADAIRVLLGFIFKELNFRKVKLSVFGFNKRAINCYKKVGFITEGVLKEEIYRDGGYHDVINMAIFKNDYI